MGQLSGSRLTPVLLAWLAVSVGYAQTIMIELKNGDRLSGKVVTETTNTIVLSNAWARELTVPLSEIVKRVVPPAITNAVASASTPVRASTNAVTNAVALAKIVASTNALFTSPRLRHWHGDIQAGVDLTFSERNRQVYNGRARLTYAKNRLKSLIEYDVTYGRSQFEDSDGEQVSQKDANRMNGLLKFDYDLTKHWYAYGIGGAGYDEIRKIDFRYEIGPGIGYRLVQMTNLAVNLEAGANYQEEEHADGDDINTFFFRLAENAAWKITPRLNLDEKFEYTPRVEDPSLYRLRFELNLRYAMLQNVFLNLTVIDIHDSDPARQVNQNDLQIRSSVGLKF
jgi:putative salt-induced outer membrane protein YdiY